MWLSERCFSVMFQVWPQRDGGGAETQESETQRKAETQRKQGKSVYTSMLVEKIMLNTLTMASQPAEPLFGLELCGM